VGAISKISDDIKVLRISRSWSAT